VRGDDIRDRVLLLDGVEVVDHGSSLNRSVCQFETDYRRGWSNRSPTSPARAVQPATRQPSERRNVYSKSWT
jgi:hypothetical protein